MAEDFIIDQERGKRVRTRIEFVQK